MFGTFGYGKLFFKKCACFWCQKKHKKMRSKKHKKMKHRKTCCFIFWKFKNPHIKKPINILFQTFSKFNFLKRKKCKNGVHDNQIPKKTYYTSKEFGGVKARNRHFSYFLSIKCVFLKFHPKTPLKNGLKPWFEK